MFTESFRIKGLCYSLEFWITWILSFQAKLSESLPFHRLTKSMGGGAALSNYINHIVVFMGIFIPLSRTDFPKI